MDENVITSFIPGVNVADWPLPKKWDDQDRDVRATGTLESRGWDMSAWENECGTGEISNCYWKMYNAEYFKIYHDTTFLVGPEKTPFSAHRLIMSVECENEVFRSSLNKSFDDKFDISLPDLDPSAFKEVLEYIYTKEINFRDVPHARNIIKIASSLGIPGLKKNCIEVLCSKLNHNNAVEIFCDALDLNDEDLKDKVASYITRNAFSVLFSDGFLTLPLEKLKAFLKNDDWFIRDEVQVFESVMRWARTKFVPNCQEQDKRPSGGDLRKILKDVIYQIRFTSLNNTRQFVLLHSKYDGFFSGDEFMAISTYIAAKTDEGESTGDTRESYPTPRPPSNFNINPRVKREMEAESPNASLDETSGSALASIEEISNTSDGAFRSTIIDTEESSRESENSNVQVTSTLHTTEVIDSSTTAIDDSSHDPPPSKKRKKKLSLGTITRGENGVSSPPPVAVTPSAPSNRIMNLHDYVNELAGKENITDIIEKINEMVKIPSMPQHRVYLPHLKEFNLTLIRNANRSFECGSTLRTYIKPKLVHLAEILFFNTKKTTTEPEAFSGEFQPQHSKTILNGLLSMKVNITIACSNLMFLKINHEKGIILMNLIKDAQDVLDGASDFPLKVLLVSECEIYSLDPVQRNLLEVIVMRRVKGFKNHGIFLKTCTNLKTVAWNDLGLQELNVNESLLNTNPHMEKLSLAKCKFTVGGNLAEHENFLQELYLDNCECKPEVMCTFPKLFPYVKRVQVYGKQADTRLLHKILQMESLQWLFVWEFVYYKVKGKRKQRGSCSVMTEDSKQLQQFLSSVFDPDFAKKEKCTFMLEKKKELIDLPPSTSCSALQKKTTNAFDPTIWEGTKLNSVKEKFDAISKLDFIHFSYDQFFPSFDEYLFFEKTETDLKKERIKEKQKVASSDNHLKEDLSLSTVDIQEPASNSSASTCDDDPLDMVMTH